MAGELLAPPHSTDNENSQSFAGRRDSVFQPGLYDSVALTDATNQIRVCSIHPGPVESQLRISFRTIDLDKSAKYVCLSYVWGDADEGPIVWLNGQHHSIRRNLHLQLPRLRANNLTQPIWCDALCINQADPRERSTQVGMMDRIFSSAVLVVLGVDDSGMTMLQQPSQGQLQTIIEKLSNDSHLGYLSCFTLNDTGRATSSYSDGIAAGQFRRLLDSSFFTRCWTVQEVVLAKDALVMGEWGVIPWSSVGNALERYNHHRESCCASLVNTLDADLRASCYKASFHTLYRRQRD